MDMPVSENAMTGIVIGSAIKGFRPIMVSQRADFFLLGLDQLINNAAKWYYMFGNKMTVPLVIRLIIGKGWGQGPQHSQSFQSFFSHIPGIKVIMPSSPYDAKGLLITAIKDNNPVICLEHRWLYNTLGNVPKEIYEIPLGEAKIIKEGKDLTLITMSYMAMEAMEAQKQLEKERIDLEILDIRTIKPLDKKTILKSISKTKRVLVLDPEWKTNGCSAEILAMIAEEAHGILMEPPKRLNYKDMYSPTSWALANKYYINSKDIVVEVLKIMKKLKKAELVLKENIKEKETFPQDVPDALFKGPF